MKNIDRMWIWFGMMAIMNYMWYLDEPETYWNAMGAVMMLLGLGTWLYAMHVHDDEEGK